MNKLLFILKKYRIECVMAPGFKMLEAIFELLVPLIIASLIDLGIGNNDKVMCYRLVIQLFVLAVLGMSLSITAQFFAAKAAVGFATDLRERLFGHMLRLSRKDWDRIGNATMITRITSDVNLTQNGVNMFLRLFLRSPFVVFGAMVMAFTIDTDIALIFAAVIAILFAVVIFLMKINIATMKETQKALDRITLRTRENIKGLRVLRAFCREKAEINQFDEALSIHRNKAVRAADISSVMNPITYILINIGIVFVISQGSVKVNVGELSKGDVVALFNYMSQILVELLKLANLVVTINKALSSADRISDILDIPVETDIIRGDDSGNKESDILTGDNNEGLPEQPVLQIKGLSFTYNEAQTPSLRDIDFCLKSGQTMGITGSTGSGKSTLVKLLLGFYDTYEGNIFVNNKDIREISKEKLRKSIGAVLQKSVIFKGTVRDNLLMGADEKIEDAALLEALRMAEADFCFGEKGEDVTCLDRELLQGGKNLSGGQRQRLSIARTLVRKPDLLIFDDSFSALDYLTDRKLRGNLKKLKNKSIIMVSQRISTIMDSDIILVLEEGRQAGLGSHRELMENCDIYREIYKSQNREDN